jgi:hypothetical protein
VAFGLVLGHALATETDAFEAIAAQKVSSWSARLTGPCTPRADVRDGRPQGPWPERGTPDDETLDTHRWFFRPLNELSSLADIPARHRLHGCLARGYDCVMDVPRTRRIWHFEAEPLCDALNEAGAWQTAVRVRVSHEEALRHRPGGTAFDVRPTPEVAPLNLALDTLRAERARGSRLS